VFSWEQELVASVQISGGTAGFPSQLPETEAEVHSTIGLRATLA